MKLLEYWNRKRFIQLKLIIEDEKLWTPAVPDTQSIPVEIIYEKKKPNQPQIVKEVYTITQFKRFLLLQEADYFVNSLSDNIS